ncbi:MAG: iron-containing alcohol dehydrogenase, partial [Alphaproteobacteria bacterium]|nr:iron-containing alcohol dehydrogenase [Alphaproteobacteria bacterium]
MDAFIYNATPSRVIFGSGTLEQIASEVEYLEAEKVLVLTTPFQKEMGEDLAGRIGTRSVGLYANATMHTPIEVTKDAIEFAKSREADLTIAIGGGSTIGLGKALTLHAGIPQIAIPTTYAGSEMTPILGQTENGKKTTLKDDKLRPKTVIYDVDLTLGLPVEMSITSGLNAIAHAMEAMYAKDQNPVVSLIAEEGIRALGRALP